MDPEKFDEMCKEIDEETKVFAKELQKYKNAFFSQLDKEVKA